MNNLFCLIDLTLQRILWPQQTAEISNLHLKIESVKCSCVMVLHSTKSAQYLSSLDFYRLRLPTNPLKPKKSKIYFAQCVFHFSRPDPSNQSMDTPIKAPIQSRDNCGAKKIRDKENSNRKDFAHIQKVLDPVLKLPAAR